MKKRYSNFSGREVKTNKKCVARVTAEFQGVLSPRFMS